ncbi:MAG: GntR family transcriptional regulator YhfZ [Chloroflexota bacterium]|nr:GntR family transcriptional regulator YhfZ [Chloroflexota bacterium]
MNKIQLEVFKIMNETKISDWRDDLLSKQGKIITLLARDLLSVESDNRLPAMQDYAGRYGASVGTVQAAFAYLSEIGAVSLDTQGKLGTFARQLAYSRLWQLAFQRAVVGALPLPYARRLAGLATGVRAGLAADGVDYAPRFVRGSMTRLALLGSGACDFAVVSRYVAESAAVYGFAVDSVLHFGVDSYTVDHVLLLRDGRNLVDGMRIGIDSNSADHAVVVRQVSRGVNLAFIEIDYSAGLDLLASGAIDATVWTRDDLPPSFGFQVVPLDSDIDVAKLGEAVLVVQAGARPIAHLINDALNVERVGELQGEVVRRERLPSY